MATADVVSSGIVGYQQITIPQGYSLFTVTFKEVSGGNYDIQGIVPYTADGAIVTANNRVAIQKMGADGGYLTVYNYRNARGGWCQGSTYLGTDAVLFADGEAMCINNTTGADIKFQVSGAVELSPQSSALGTGYSLVGNMTPATIDIQDIVPRDAEGNVITANNRVSIQKMGTDGGYLTVYNYRSARGGWCQGSTYVGTSAVTFAPGESFCLNNTTGSTVILDYKSPMAE